MSQFHYTDRLSGREILQSKCIRAKATTLHKDMMGKDAGLQTPPLVWLSINPVLEGTTFSKLTIAGGWSTGLVNDLWRFVFPREYAPLGLAEYADHVKIDLDWFGWMVRTGEIMCSNYTTWRCCPRDIPSTDWVGVEVLSGYADHGPIWTPLPDESTPPDETPITE